MNQLLKISLFYCSNSFSSDAISYCVSQVEDVEINTFSLPCSGKVDILYLLKGIETGSDAVFLMTCKLGECKFVQGNLRAQKRVDAVNSILLESGSHFKPVRFLQVEDSNKIKNILNEINNCVKQLKLELNTTSEPA
jgi:coenzyme F420-reducing hydrogenase delta subunit